LEELYESTAAQVVVSEVMLMSLVTHLPQAAHIVAEFELHQEHLQAQGLNSPGAAASDPWATRAWRVACFRRQPKKGVLPKAAGSEALGRLLDSELCESESGDCENGNKAEDGCEHEVFPVVGPQVWGGGSTFATGNLLRVPAKSSSIVLRQHLCSRLDALAFHPVHEQLVPSKPFGRSARLGRSPVSCSDPAFNHA
jgi:hypothetical protein